VALYADDFTIRAGRSKSAGGVYMIYPEYLVADRLSRHAVHVIGVTPAGLSCDKVLHAISDALKVGTNDEWPVNAPDGLPIRVFVNFFWGGEIPSCVEVKPSVLSHGCGALLFVRRSNMQWRGVSTRRYQLFVGHNSFAHDCLDPSSAAGDTGARILTCFFCTSLLRAHRLSPGGKVSSP